MLHSGGSTILVYLKISIECFVLLLIMMNSEQDKDAAIRTYTGNPKFRDLLKKKKFIIRTYSQEAMV